MKSKQKVFFMVAIQKNSLIGLQKSCFLKKNVYEYPPFKSPEECFKNTPLQTLEIGLKGGILSETY